MHASHALNGNFESKNVLIRLKRFMIYNEYFGISPGNFMTISREIAACLVYDMFSFYEYLVQFGFPIEVLRVGLWL